MKSFYLAILTTIFLCQNVQAGEAPIAWYPFSGNSLDLTASGHHGIVHGATLTKDRFGFCRSAYHFDGDDYIEIPVHPDFNAPEISVSLWFRADDISKVTDPFHPHHILINKEHSFELAVNGMSAPMPEEYGAGEPSEVIFAYDQDWKWKESGYRIRTNEWIHVVMNYEAGNKVRIFVNGEARNDFKYTQSIGENENCIRIGARGCNRPDLKGFFIGDIDDIRIYDRGLTRLEVLNLYREDTAPPGQIIENQANRELTEWSKPGIHERPEDYQKRIGKTNAASKEFAERAMLAYAERRIDLNCRELDGSVNSTGFRLQIPGLLPVELSAQVPASERQFFIDGLDQLVLSGSTYKIMEGGALAVNCLTIYNPINGKTYKLPCDEASKPNSEMETRRRDELDFQFRLVAQSNPVEVTIWDNNKEDGDVISILLNDEWIARHLKVTKKKSSFIISLQKGSNTFVMKAENEGRYPPNTAAVSVSDGIQTQVIELTSSKVKSGAIEIILE